MTLQDLFAYTETHPLNVVFYFSIIPFAALLAGWMEREEGHLPPWNYLYSTLIYLVAVPAILSVAYSIYRWLFERGSIMEANLLLQFLPVASLLLTFFIIKRQVKIPTLPGFDRLGGLVMMVTAAMAIMYFVDRLRIVAFMRLSVSTVVLVFIVLLVVIRLGWRRLAA